jgi:RND family efflux transporter MFP subunit
MAFAVVMIALRPSVPMKKPPVPVPYVDVLEVRPEDRTVFVETYGTIQPALVSQLVAEVSGRIEWVSPVFVNGGFFEEGEELLRIEDADYRLAVAQAEAQVAQAVLALDRERRSAETAAREWMSLGTGTPAPLALHRPQVDQAEAAVEASRAALAKARRDLSKTRIRAPFDGRIRQKYVDCVPTH